MARWVVKYDWYGCASGCCGMVLEDDDGNRVAFAFEHWEGDADQVAADARDAWGDRIAADDQVVVEETKWSRSMDQTKER
jgi:hypothetical protein